MKYLITGGAGFLGSNLASKLLEQGHEVVALDNYYTGSVDNVTPFLGNSKYRFINHDVTSPYFVEVDGIFNLACPASPIQYQKHPVETLRTSVLGSLNALELAKQTKTRILQASTSEVYGNPSVSPQPESYWGNVNPFGIRSCYDEGKRAAETLFFDFHHQFDVDIRIARIFNTYGPNMALDDGRVVSNFIIQALTNQDITIYGDGNQTRSFCFVDDLIDGLIRLFDCPNINSPVNLGNPVSISMKELAEEIIELTCSKSKLVFTELPGDDPSNRKPDITLAKDLLSWTPSTDRNVGLVKTIEYFRTTLANAKTSAI
jgi:UDP-glucuronate decarboxylase